MTTLGPMWWSWLACGGDRVGVVIDRVHDSAPTSVVLDVGPADAIWGRDALWCRADDGSRVAWSVDGAEVATEDGVVPAPLVRAGSRWECTAQGATPRVLEPQVAGGNVLVLLVDDIGRDRLRSFGGTEARAQTPAIDALRDRGVVFERAWATTVCSSSRASLYTGRHPHRTGIGGLVEKFDRVSMRTTEVTLPAALRVAATPYHSLLVGKWHLAGLSAGPRHPLTSGFDHFFGSMANLDSAFQFSRPPEPDVPLGYFQFEWNVEGVVAWQNGYATALTVETFERELAALPEPWLSVVALNGAHKPWHYPPEGWRRSDLPPPQSDSHTVDAMVESVDVAVERILAAAGPDATIVFLADNGTVEDVLLPPYTGAEGYSKGTVHEAGINVPMVVAGPLVRTPGISDALVEITDVYDTVLAIAGLTTARVDDALGGPVERDSVSLLPYFGDPALPSLREVAFAERFEPNGVGLDNRLLYFRAARDDRYKLIRYDMIGTEPFEGLYDLGHDLVEGDPLAAADRSPDAQAAYERLSAVLASETTP